jgi:hypothetical protein
VTTTSTLAARAAGATASASRPQMRRPRLRPEIVRVQSRIESAFGRDSIRCLWVIWRELRRAKPASAALVSELGAWLDYASARMWRNW